jgi:hypothetical protein
MNHVYMGCIGTVQPVGAWTCDGLVSNKVLEGYLFVVLDDSLEKIHFKVCLAEWRTMHVTQALCKDFACIALSIAQHAPDHMFNGN